FPTTPGAFDPSLDGSYDAFVSKLDPTGAALVFSTFIGGGGTDAAYRLAVADASSVVVGGATTSPDFPVTPGAFDTVYGNGDAFLTKLAANGSALEFSTFVGGTLAGESIQALVIGSDSAVFATGETLSTDFPTTPGAFD